jgi:hypothetical protein
MGAPRIQPRLYAFLKLHPGELFTPRQIQEALKLKTHAITYSLNALAKHHPTTMKREPLGKTGRMALFGYRAVTKKTNGGIVHNLASIGTSSLDVLVTIPIGNDQSATLDVVTARKVYEQLRLLFGGDK